MKQLCGFLLALLPFLMSACTEEGFVKIFECDPVSPYFSTYTHKCYKTEAERNAADEERKIQMEGKYKPSTSSDDDEEEEPDAEEEESGKSGSDDEEESGEEESGEDE